MSTTLVTALYDIGRSAWNPTFKRPNDQYLRYLSNILSLDSNIVIYVQQKNYENVLNLRKLKDPDLKKTKIVVTRFSELECFQKFYDKTRNVMNSDAFKSRLIESHTPESKYPEYNIINFNKVSFLEQEIKYNTFNSDYFMWIDAGFYHDKFPSEYLNITYPNPEKIKVLDDNKVHFLSMDSQIELDSYFSPKVTIAGSMFAGKAEPLLKLKDLCYSVIEDFLNDNAMNDDQTVYAFAYKKNKELFNLTQGTWFDNFKLYV